MKVKTSVTLSDDLVAMIDERVAMVGNRSEFIERAVRTFLAQLERSDVNRRDLSLLDEHAARLNSEAEDVLEFQIPALEGES